MTQFTPGLDLNRQFWRDCVAPLINQYWPNLVGTAALVGYGSDVLGFDDAVSMDHNWGPRMLLILDDADHATLAKPIHDLLAERLPPTFLGFPVSYEPKDTFGITRMMTDAPRPFNHLVEILTLRDVLVRGFGAPHADRLLGGPPDNELWLALPEQGLLTLTAGAVYNDDRGLLTALRLAYACYPDDIRRAKIISLLHGVESEEAFVGRAASLGDHRGARLIAGRLCGLVMKICFYLENRYIPYSKWFGPAFSRLKCATIVGPAVDAVQEAGLAAIPEQLARLFEVFMPLLADSGLAGSFEPVCRNYHDRPWRVMHAARLIQALTAKITDPALRPRDLALINLGRILDGYEQK